MEDGRGVRLLLGAGEEGDKERFKGMFVCGDHRDTATLNGAISSGKKAAEEIIKDMKS